MELQSEVHSWGSSPNEQSFSSAAFLIEGEMFFCGTWTTAGGNGPGLERKDLQPSRSHLGLPHSFLPLVSY